MIRSFEGLVGCKFPEHSTFVTSPNMQMIYHPLLGERHVRMRCDWHFGEDDPLHHPQPWSSKIGHLAVIRIANQDTTRPGDTILWWPPHIDDFEPIDHQSATTSQTPTSALGHINQTHRELLLGAIVPVLKRTSPFLQKDAWVRLLSAHLKTLRALLDLPASFTEAAIVFTLTQRVALELAARIDWLTTYRDFFNGLSVSSKKRDLTYNMVGALTDDLIVAEKLFMVHIFSCYFISISLILRQGRDTSLVGTPA